MKRHWWNELPSTTRAKGVPLYLEEALEDPTLQRAPPFLTCTSSTFLFLSFNPLSALVCGSDATSSSATAGGHGSGRNMLGLDSAGMTPTLPHFLTTSNKTTTMSLTVFLPLKCYVYPYICLFLYKNVVIIRQIYYKPSFGFLETNCERAD